VQSTESTSFLVNFADKSPEIGRNQPVHSINNEPKSVSNLPIERGDDDASPERHSAPRQDLDGNRAANHLLYVGADERELGHGPERARGPGRVLLAAELGEVLPRGHPEPRGEQLNQRAHDRRPQEQPQQLVPRGGARLQVPLQVSRVQERDAHEEARAREAPELPPREGRARRRAAAVGFGVGVRDGDGDLVVRVVGALLVLVVRVGGGGGGGIPGPAGEEALGEVAGRHVGGVMRVWASAGVGRQGEWEDGAGSYAPGIMIGLMVSSRIYTVFLPIFIP